MIWKIVAFIVSRRLVAEWLIERAQRTPYFHLPGYMSRWWLFNPYGGGSQGEADQADDRARHRARWPWLPSIRIHHIHREDLAAHPHDHPYDARTIILYGWYLERTLGGEAWVVREGDTQPVVGYHHIEQVSEGGVWTIFITWDYQGDWGFLVDGKKVPWREYEANHERYNPPEETIQLIGKRAHNLNQVIDEVRVGQPLNVDPGCPDPGVFSPLNACCFRDECRANATAIAGSDRRYPLGTQLNAIRLLIDAGHLDKEAAATALLIARGFQRGPLAPPSEPVGIEGLADLCIAALGDLPCDYANVTREQMAAALRANWCLADRGSALQEVQ